MNDKIPVTIITGFLGAGKTTFLNKLIATHPQKKFAIIMNEFGDIPIDQDLVIDAGEDIFELSNGCICCSLNVELGQLLQKLIEGNYSFNHLLIETTGIAEPDGIAAAFIGEGKNSIFELSSTICLTDALSIQNNLEERGEAVKQVSFSDVIILNKIDLVPKTNLVPLKKSLKKYNSDALILEAENGLTHGPDLTDVNAYDGHQLEKKLIHEHHHHHHHEEMVAHGFSFEEALDPMKFEHWINMLLFLSGYQIYRVKGILNIEGENNRLIFQSVRSQIRLETGSPWGKNEIRFSRIVFIGYNIKKAPLERGLEGCKIKIQAK